MNTGPVIGLRPGVDLGRGPSVEYGHLGRFPYHRVGDGDRRLLVVPGLSDALGPQGPSRATAEWFARRFYADLTDVFDVWVVSRPRGMPEEYTTRDVAGEYASLLDRTGPASVLGLSMGGLIAQHLAADYPDLVDKLVLGVSGHRLGDEGRRAVRRWRDWAEAGEWLELALDATAATYAGYRRLLYPPLLRAANGVASLEPENPADAVTSCRACLGHDAEDELDAVDAPTLVLGGAADRLFPESVLRKTTREIPDAKLGLLGGVGHGAPEERRGAFNRAVRSFLLPG